LIVDFEVVVNNDIEGVLSAVKQAFQQGGWQIVSEGAREFTVSSPLALEGNKFLYAKFFYPEGKGLPYGLDVAVYRELDESGSPQNPITFGSTVHTAGIYTLVTTSTAFFLLPPIERTHRFRYGTWAGLLKPLEGNYPFQVGGNIIPLFFLSDRWMGDLTRQYNHVVSTQPTHFVQYPNGFSTNDFLPLRVHPGIGLPFGRVVGGKMRLSTLMLGLVMGNYLLPPLHNPELYLLWEVSESYSAPRKTVKGYLVNMPTPLGELVPCAEVPPDGASLLARSYQAYGGMPE